MKKLGAVLSPVTLSLLHRTKIKEKLYSLTFNIEQPPFSPSPSPPIFYKKCFVWGCKVGEIFQLLTNKAVYIHVMFGLYTFKFGTLGLLKTVETQVEFTVKYLLASGC